VRRTRFVSRLTPGAVGVVLLLGLHAAVPAGQSATLPTALPDREFWALTGQLSEPNGAFRSNSGSPDNLLSNEIDVSTVAASLAERVKPGGVYLGVGPEQNFTYIAAMRPRMVFVIDIRRGNLHLHLLYKALFELSDTRTAFVARLFSRQRPSTLAAKASAAALMHAYLQMDALDEAGFTANLRAVAEHLTKTRGFPLSADDLAGIEYVYRQFHQFGPAIHYTSSIGGRRGAATYAAIMSAPDAMTGTERTYLATDDNFAFVKALQTRNLIVPVVGDFAGPQALRAVGAYVRARGATVSAFYVSNVEMYLKRNSVWPAFCANVATMPLDADSVFIRPGSGRSRSFAAMTAETAGCAGR
jgi:hypothetical protein